MMCLLRFPVASNSSNASSIHSWAQSFPLAVSYKQSQKKMTHRSWSRTCDNLAIFWIMTEIFLLGTVCRYECWQEFRRSVSGSKFPARIPKEVPARGTIGGTFSGTRRRHESPLRTGWCCERSYGIFFLRSCLVVDSHVLSMQIADDRVRNE